MLNVLLPVIGPIINSLVERIPDPAAAQKAKLEAEAALLAASIEQMKGQVQINVEEAKHSSIFVAGWRPAIGWSAAIAFMFLYVIAPIAGWVASWFGTIIPMPKFDAEALMSLTLALLGIASLRTFEKSRGLTK